MNIRNLKSNGWIWNYVQIKFGKGRCKRSSMTVDGNRLKGLNKIIKNIDNLCKIIINDLERIGMKNSIFEKIKIDFYRNELVLN